MARPGRRHLSQPGQKSIVCADKIGVRLLVPQIFEGGILELMQVPLADEQSGQGSGRRATGRPVLERGVGEAACQRASVGVEQSTVGVGGVRSSLVACGDKSVKPRSTAVVRRRRRWSAGAQATRGNQRARNRCPVVHELFDRVGFADEVVECHGDKEAAIGQRTDRDSDERKTLSWGGKHGESKDRRSKRRPEIQRLSSTTEPKRGWAL